MATPSGIYYVGIHNRGLQDCSYILLVRVEGRKCASLPDLNYTLYLHLFAAYSGLELGLKSYETVLQGNWDYFSVELAPDALAPLLSVEFEADSAVGACPEFPEIYVAKDKAPTLFHSQYTTANFKSAGM